MAKVRHYKSLEKLIDMQGQVIMDTNFYWTTKNEIKPTHIAFCDESYQGRYAGLGVISLQYANLEKVESSICEILEKSSISEFKK